METNLTGLNILEYVGVSLIPWVIALIIGGGLGYLFAILFRGWFKRHPRVINLIMLLPWRSITIFICLVIAHSPFLVWNFGIGSLTAGIGIGMALFVLFVPWVTHTYLNSWYPANMRVKFISLVRTFTILSLAIPVLFQTAGMGYLINKAISVLDVPSVRLGYSVVGVMMLGADLIFGLIQFALVDR